MALLLPLIILSVAYVHGIRYEPNWQSLDSRPLPAWYDEAKFGIFIHWGVFSVPGYSPDHASEWLWWYWKGQKLQPYIDYMAKNYRPDFMYADFAKDFTAEFFDANEWANLFQASGAEYMVFTAKHHEGFCNWPTNHSFNWNSMSVGPKRDIVGELAAAIRSNTSLHFGLYHSLFEWFNPLYLRDKANNFTTQDFVFDKTLPELYELIKTYKPDVIWSDGAYGGSPEYWQALEFLAWLYNDSPVKDTVVTNDRWGTGTSCRHGGFLTCADRYQPGHLLERKWETAVTVDLSSWGYRRNAVLDNYVSTRVALTTLIRTVSYGGNMLMNIGPTSSGTIAPIFEERLRDMGAWLSVNNEGIKGTRPWIHQNDTIARGLWYTKKGTIVYAISFYWPDSFTLNLGAPVTTPTTAVTMLGYSGTISWKARPTSGIDITLPPIPFNKLPCQNAWTFKMSGLSNIE
ncbi:alpha-L-fucosidase-like [Patella vulgata]|uniref:alpha-L-fucosidase-like n=1 Tax=Patella vulgata TaxID=6465 RepID=UPI0024A8F817|nr:alpha-L-fucosidase-like [Patella vulgata]